LLIESGRISGSKLPVEVSRIAADFQKDADSDPDDQIIGLIAKAP